VESPPVRQTPPLLATLQRALFLGSIIGLGWVAYAAAMSGRPFSDSAVPVLMWSAVFLGTGGPMLGDRHPRVRWALVIASGVLLIVTLVLLNRITRT
jgi:hypothetical protein